MTTARPTARNWRNAAACREEDPELFYPAGTTGPFLIQIDQATAVCRRCLALDACYRWALDTRQSEGIWGGSTPEERKSHLRRIERNRAKNRQEAAS